MRLALYLRVSTEKQAEEGDSMETQEARLRAWALAMRHEVVDVFRDAGISGSVPWRNRPGLCRAVNSTADYRRADAPEGIAAVSLDRFSRSTLDTLDLALRAKEGGWKLVSLRESLDTSTAAGELVLTVLSAMAQFERTLASERTIAVLDRKKARGEVWSPTVPWGFRAVRGRVIPDTVEQSILDIVEAFRVAREPNGKGRRRSAVRDLRDLIAADWPTNPRTGKAWTLPTVRMLLYRPPADLPDSVWGDEPPEPPPR